MMDSRTYAFIFPINNPDDIPQDFRATVNGLPFEHGVFIPQEDVDRFAPTYPARVLLLAHSILHIIPHPSSDEPTRQLNLDTLIEFETGTILLFGWIRFSTAGSDIRLPYNTCVSAKFDEFVAALRQKWLGPIQEMKLPKEHFGAPLDIKFGNLLAGEMTHHESVLIRYFSTPAELTKRAGLLRRVKSQAGHLLALTTGNRLLWLKDEYGPYRERYACVAVSRPVLLFKQCYVHSEPTHTQITIDFALGPAWTIATTNPPTDSSQFADALNSHLTHPKAG